jgi:hypothetical protein
MSIKKLLKKLDKLKIDAVNKTKYIVDSLTKLLLISILAAGILIALTDAASNSDIFQYAAQLSMVAFTIGTFLVLAGSTTELSKYKKKIHCYSNIFY